MIRIPPTPVTNIRNTQINSIAERFGELVTLLLPLKTRVRGLLDLPERKQRAFKNFLICKTPSSLTSRSSQSLLHGYVAILVKCVLESEDSHVHVSEECVRYYDTISL